MNAEQTQLLSKAVISRDEWNQIVDELGDVLDLALAARLFYLINTGPLPL